MTERVGRHATRLAVAQQEEEAEARPGSAPPALLSYRRETSHRATFVDEETLVRRRDELALRVGRLTTSVP